jgi:hypothetical protein
MLAVLCCPALFHGREDDAARNQCDPYSMVDVELLSQEYDCQDGTEHRHQMPGLAGASRSYQLDSPIEEQVSDEGREHRGGSQGEPRRQAALDPPALGNFP